ncbi:serine/threonine-protein kinase [Streptomyces sp. cg36]|uniref:serine/threonine-protein kinase n=1 Tax=Streptomyces sp. cg36 TaxID=3238798 RepID=UPI0034E1DCBA
MERLGSGDPSRIGTYRLLARLGTGGMGRVYLARSDRGRTAAVKLVHRELADLDEFRARFRQEVAAARRVGGDWTAPVLDADTEAPVPWVATGYVAGPSLHAVVSGGHGPLPAASLRVLARGLALALRDIHSAGLIHRDLKPSNVLITLDGPRVIDFGIARALETVAEGGLTRTGALVGSPGFMAPEQVRGDRVTPACDVFCLGSVLAYAATGRLPFSGTDSGVHAMMFRIAQEPPDLEGVPEPLLDLVRACLSKEPAERPSLADVLSGLGPQDASPAPWLPLPLVARLGSQAVELLEIENPESPTNGALARPGTPDPAPAPEAHAPEPGPAPEPEPYAPAPPPWATGGHSHAPQNQPPAYGYPAPGQPPAPAYGYGYPDPGQPAGHGYAHPAPTYGYAPVPPPEEPPRRSAKSTAALIAVALVVAVGAGGAVYAYMNSPIDEEKTTGGSRSTANPPSEKPSSRTDGGPSDEPSPSPSASAPGDIPAKYLGTWSGTVEGDGGAADRHLVLRPGKVGDQVMTLTADGPAAGGGAYHCVFRAALTARPSTPDAPLKLGPSTVETGEPATSCTPGAATTLTVLPDGRLRRENDSNGDQLVYDRVSRYDGG